MLFFDQNNMKNQRELKSLVNSLEEQKEYIIAETANLDAEIEKIKVDTAEMERNARERYFMKRDNEVIYVVVDENKMTP